MQEVAGNRVSLLLLREGLSKNHMCFLLLSEERFDDSHDALGLSALEAILFQLCDDPVGVEVVVGDNGSLEEQGREIVQHQVGIMCWRRQQWECAVMLESSCPICWSVPGMSVILSCTGARVPVPKRHGSRALVQRLSMLHQ